MTVEQKIFDGLDEMYYDGFVDSNCVIHAGSYGITIEVNGTSRNVIIDIMDSGGFSLEVYNPDKDSFHYSTERKSVKSVLNYVDKHIN